MRKKIQLAVGLATIFIPQFLTVDIQFKILAIFIGAIWLWVSSFIEIGSIACLGALCLLPNVKPATVFANSFGNVTIQFLIFSFLLTYALAQTGILRKIAIYFIDNKFAKRNVYCFLGLYLLSMLIVGSFMAPTTVFILYFAIVHELADILQLQNGDPLAKRLMIGTAFTASISCAFTPIAHTFPIMALGYYQEATNAVISYITYMKYSIPIGLFLMGFTFLLLCIKLPNTYQLKSITFTKTKTTLKEYTSLAVFFIVVISWLLIGLDALPWLKNLGTAWPAIIGCVVLASINCLDIKKGFSNGISWSAILLCAATLALSSFITKDEYGIMPYIKTAIMPLLNTISPLYLIVAFTLLMTNVTSNIVTTQVSYALFVPVLIATPIFDPEVATILIGISASLAYVLPSSIAHIAIAGGSGMANAKNVAFYGTIVMLISFGAICVIGGLLL